jgi:hypothetical protein
METINIKPAEETIKETISKIPQLCALAIEKNINTSYAIFFDLSGHVDKFYLEIGKDKHKNFCNKIYRLEIKLVAQTIIKEQTAERAQIDLEKLNKCLEFLNGLQ